MHTPAGSVTRRRLLQGSGTAAATALFRAAPVLAQESTPTTGTPTPGSGKPRARDLGVPFDGDPGPLNAITDVPGVAVGHVTLVAGDGPLVVGQGPIRTGVTAVLPRGADPLVPVFGAYHRLNGNGELTGSHWIEESGFVNGPVMLTTTYSVGTVRDALAAYAFSLFGAGLGLPVVAETLDDLLNDVHGQHVEPEHVLQAFRAAAGGPVAEGNVGGGTGMVCHGFKGGIGTASRVFDHQAGRNTVGALVQANYGFRETLRIAGVPVGREIADLLPEVAQPQARGAGTQQSSIIVVVATDAPLLPHQLKRLAQRAGLGLAVVGGRGEDFSGDLFLAFSTAPVGNPDEMAEAAVGMLPNATLTAFFHQVAQATEEAIVNAMVAAETMSGIDGTTVHALPHDRLRAVLAKYNRLAD
jgi:D-aminopeptidase